jgi:outer membrane protein assembly factor BamB
MAGGEKARMVPPAPRLYRYELGAAVQTQASAAPLPTSTPNGSNDVRISFLKLAPARLALVATLLPLGSPAAPAAEGVGWRTDGTGSYPKARPPLEWSPTKNVVWCTPMPGYGVSHPVPLGKRLLICSEPATLLCLDKDDGRILWQKTSSYSELEIAPDVRARLKEELADMAVRVKKRSAVEREMNLLDRALRKDKAPREEVENKLRPFRKRVEEMRRDEQKLTLAVLYTQPGIHSVAGYSAPTPVTDGKDVFVAFGNGLVACFDLDGNRKWLKLIEHSNAAYAHSGSPVLAGDKVLIHFTDLVALDPKTGLESWRLKRPTSHGTPLVTRIGDTDVVLTPNGAMVRARDGKLLADRLGSCGANSPVLHDGIVYYVHGAALAVRLPDSVAEPPVKVPALWKGRVKGGGYWFSSPVVHDGLLYEANDQGLLTALDAATGATVYEQRLNLGGTTYPSISTAGNRIYVSSDNGATVVVQPGREYRELARNKLEPFRSSLVFEGRRVYVRTAKSLYCIGE